ncbi:MAG: uroporphyrinogen-III synthase [Hyphomicrobiales bacterium]
MRIIITRPPEDAKATITQLNTIGHEGILAPLLEIAAVKSTHLPDEKWQAILVSSANGVRALESLDFAEDLKKFPLLAVGDASAKIAKDAGFQRVASANGDLNALVEKASETLKPADGPLLYLSGKVVSGDLKTQLELRGFIVHRLELYEANAALKMPDAAAQALANHDADGVALFSRRSAKIWLSFLPMPGFLEAATELTHFCLSQAVADELGADWPSQKRRPRIIVAKSANMTGFLSSVSDTA